MFVGEGTCPICGKEARIDWSKPSSEHVVITVMKGHNRIEVCSNECADIVIEQENNNSNENNLKNEWEKIELTDNAWSAYLPPWGNWCHLLVK